MTKKNINNRYKYTEALLTSIVDTIDEGVLVIDNKGDILFLNERFLELGKIKKQELPEYDNNILRSLFSRQLIYPDKFLDEVEKIEQSEKTVCDKIYCKENIVLERYSKIVYNDNNRKVGRIWCFRDVTHESLLTKSLNESFTKLKRIVEHTYDAVILIDEKGKVILWNPAAEKILEQKEESVLNTSYDKVILKMNLEAEFSKNSKEIIKNIPKYLHSSFRKRQDSIEGIFYSSDEKIKYLETHIFDIKVQEGVWTGLHIRDITERKIANMKLEEYTKSLENIVAERTKSLTDTNTKLQESIEDHKKTRRKLIEALEKERELNELKSRFISTASHEFRNPLTSISFSAELLQKHWKKIETNVQQELVADILDSVSYLTNLMDDVLTVNRSESGKLSFNPENTNVQKCCFEIIKSLKWMMIEEHNLETEFNINEDYFVDRKLLGLILTNILSNAIKYSPDGGAIKIKVDEVNKMLVFIVLDNGIGIPEEQQKNIFSQFYRCDNAINIQGTGLGLDIVKRAVDLHDGNIYFTSTPNEGTTFTVEIPVFN